MRPLVSVIIPWNNKSTKNLAECLEAVANQTYLNIETILISKPLAETGETRSRQKNRAIMAAEGEFIFRVDADIILRPDVIEKAVAMCTMGSYDFIAVHNLSPTSNTVLGKVRQLEWEMLARGKYHLAGNFARRKDIIKAGLFNESLYAGEEYDLHNRMVADGLKFGVLEDTYALHKGEPGTLRDVVSKNVHYGKNISVFVSRNGIVQMQPFRLAYLKAIPKFGLYFIPFAFYKAIQYLSAGLGLALSWFG